jgi:Probable sensor domain DACNV
MTYATPERLATRVSSRLRQLGRPGVGTATLNELFAGMYYASLRSEERVPVRFAVVYLDPRSPDPSPPMWPPNDRWSCTTLASALIFDASTISKLAAGTDPRSSALAVFEIDGALRVWGLIDQQNRFHDFVNYDSDRGPERPGVFQAQVVGPGHIAAFVDYSRVGELRIDSLAKPLVSVLDAGPIRLRLDAGIRAYRRVVRDSLEPEMRSAANRHRADLTRAWIGSLSRLLLRAQNYGHGGTIILSPDESNADLDVKFSLDYRRLSAALAKRGKAVIESDTVGSIIADDYMNADAESLPLGLHVDYILSESDLEEIASEIDGATRFVSLLTRVDGLVLLRPSMDVVGFGAVITAEDPPDVVVMATTRSPSSKTMRPVDYDRFGTRHRSVMRYCWRHPAAVGFVISQDGDVRAMMRLGARLVMWENVRLQVEVDYWRARMRAAKREAARSSESPP